MSPLTYSNMSPVYTNQEAKQKIVSHHLMALSLHQLSCRQPTNCVHYRLTGFWITATYRLCVHVVGVVSMPIRIIFVGIIWSTSKFLGPITGNYFWALCKTQQQLIDVCILYNTKRLSASSICCSWVNFTPAISSINLSSHIGLQFFVLN